MGTSFRGIANHWPDVIVACLHAPGHSFDEKFLVVLIIDVDFILFVWLSAPNAYLY